jgi:hypothetical protein
MRLVARSWWARPSAVAALYLAVALVMTWPLAAVIARDIAGDTGDTLFNCWILLWTSGQVLAALTGDVSALGRYWNANIFHPAPLTLAYSDHLTPQMLQGLPVLAATGNIVLTYNLLFLSTIVLSGLGMYLLVRELTDQPLAACLAGFAFAFAPYRIDQYEHLQVLSSQWMPFALFGFRRFFANGAWTALAIGASALVVQMLSCGYYLAYFPPFALAYVFFELTARGRLRDARTWRALLVAGAASLVVVGLFSWPYVRVRQIADVGVRPAVEIEHFSADTRAFATASNRSLLWGARVRAWPHDEGQGFPGFTILVFASIGIGGAVVRAARATRAPGSRLVGRSATLHPSTGSGRASRRGSRYAVAGVLTILILLVLLLAYVLVTGPGVVTIAGVVVRYGSDWLLAQIAIVAAALAIVSPRFRALVRGVKGSPTAFFAWAALAAAWMSLGPTMYANGRRMGPGLYDVFYRWVPGFNGLRVPSLHFMIVACMLAVVAGLGAAYAWSSGRRGARALVAAGMIGILLESWSTTKPTAVPAISPIYTAVHDLPAGSAVAEFPFGDVGAEIRYTFFSGFHRKPILNGYSGYFPTTYVKLLAQLWPMPSTPEAWNALIGSGATHALVHEAVTGDQNGRAISDWLRAHGAREVTASGTDRLFALR